jgi:CNT family concentrative nucleoside transporter
MNDLGLRALSALGFVLFIGVAWLCSSDRKSIRWETVVWGVGLQFALALLLLKTAAGGYFFLFINRLVDKLLTYTQAGTAFVFGPLLETGFSFALNVLPLIVFMGAVFSVLYHLGVMQPVVNALASGLSRTMKLSGAESLAAVANVFVGMVESFLVIKPFVMRMTRSELFCTMTLGMATVAGSVLLAYVGILGSSEYAGHLVTASILSAPAGLMIAKIMIPETEQPESGAGVHVAVPRDSINVIDAAAEGALNGLKMAAAVGAMILAFVALIALLNDAIGAAGAVVGIADLSFERLLGWALAPVAFVMGVPWEDAAEVGAMLGVKTVVNEFVAYQQLGEAIQAGELAHRSQLIASYALCGFANFGSLAILLGGIDTIAPGRRHDAAKLGLWSILAGSLTTFMTACVAGILL